MAALGSDSESTLPPDRLAGVLLGLAAVRARPAAPVFSILPVTPLDAGGDTTAYRVDPVGLGDCVRVTLAANARSATGQVRVYVYNGTYEHGVGAAARARLVAAGLDFVGSSNEATDGRTTSVLLVAADTPPLRTAGERVATALGLPASAVQVSARNGDAADVVVLTGSDFRPSAP